MYRSLIANMASLVFILGIVEAGQKTWVGGMTGNRTWSLSSNWSPAGAPGASDTVNVTNGNLVVFNVSSATVAAVNLQSGSLSMDKTGGTLTVLGDFLNCGSITFPKTTNLVIQSNLTNAGTFSCGVGTVTYNGTGSQPVQPTTYNILTINNQHGVSLVDSTTVLQQLILQNGIVTTNQHALRIENSATNAVQMQGGSINGSLSRSVSSTQTGTYYFGNGATSIEVTTPGYTAISVTLHPDADPPGLNELQLNTTVRRYCVISGSGSGVSNLTLQYNESEVRGTESNYVLWRFNGASWANEGGIADPVNNVVTLYGATVLDGTWAISESQSPLPITLASFTGTVVNGNDVRLAWMTVSEINNYGFFVERRAAGESAFTVLPNSFVPGNGTTLEPRYYDWTDEGRMAGVYQYRLRQMDLDGTVSYSDPIEVSVENPTGLQSEKNVAASFMLAQNFPNPFNPSTTIQFTVEKFERAVLRVFNTLGQEIATLFDALAEPGTVHSTRFQASQLGSGIYYYTLVTDSKQETRRMMLVK